MLFIWHSVELAYRWSYGCDTLWSSGCVGPNWRGWDFVIFWVRGIKTERVRFCDLLGVWDKDGESEILWSSGCVVPSWKGWDFVIFWVCGTKLERVRFCDLLGVWYQVGEGEILWSSGCVGSSWWGWGENLSRQNFCWPLANLTADK